MALFLPRLARGCGWIPVVSILCLLSTGPGVAAAASGNKDHADTQRDRAEALYVRAMEAIQRGEFIVAAEAFDEAYGLTEAPILLWNAGRAWEKGGELEQARVRFVELLAMEGLEDALKGKVDEALGRVGKALGILEKPAPEPDPPKPMPEAEPLVVPAPQLPAVEPVIVLDPSPRDDVTTLSVSHSQLPDEMDDWGWSSLGVGVASLSTGVALVLMAESDRTAVRDAQENAQEMGNGRFRVTSMTLDEAERLERRANELWPAGIAMLTLGGALVVTATVLLALDEEASGNRSDVSIGIAPHHDGAFISAGARF